MKRVAILISGRGSNMAALIASAEREDYCEIALVLSNRGDAAGLMAAAECGIETLAIDHKAFPSREAFDADLDKALRERSIDIIALAGFMRILSPGFVAKWPGRILNIHPSLLPLFPGTRVHEQALAAGVKESGATVHFVVPELDAGPIIGQAKVPVLVSDTAETLGARVLEAEHKLYPGCLKLLCEGAVRLESGHAVFAGRGGPLAL
ncbi:MAG: phosphoribosylglycinamide formyltransferase [Alphaproteobacteria bacterium]